MVINTFDAWEFFSLQMRHNDQHRFTIKKLIKKTQWPQTVGTHWTSISMHQVAKNVLVSVSVLPLEINFLALQSWHSLLFGMQSTWYLALLSHSILGFMLCFVLIDGNRARDIPPKEFYKTTTKTNKTGHLNQWSDLNLLCLRSHESTTENYE